MNHDRRKLRSAGTIGLLAALAIGGAITGVSQNRDPDVVTTLGSTVPNNGDVNPYGVARVPRTTGHLVQGQFLVSNFNNAANNQGTGTTIVQMSPNGKLQLFAQIDPGSVSCPGGVGLTTALVAFQSGLVVVGSLPTTDGTAATAKAGCLLVLNSSGNVIMTISGKNINGPWDMAAYDAGDKFALFVTNVLNGTVAAKGRLVSRGTVVRLVFTVDDAGIPHMTDNTIIASGFPERTDPAALVIGPTGVAFDPASGNLFVADSLDNRIAVVPSALFRSDSAKTGSTLSVGGALNDPLGMSFVSNRLFVTNGNDGRIIELDSQTGQQLDADFADTSGGPPPGAGALFGLWAVDTGTVYFVDDAVNTFNLLH